MDRFDRIFALHRLLAGRRVPIPLEALCRELECSAPTVKRTIAAMRNFLDAPIEYDREHNGYRYASRPAGNWELPGLWFSAAELQALLTLERLLCSLSPGLLTEELRPFRERIEGLLQRQQVGTGELHARLRLLAMGARDVPPAQFRAVATALGARRRLTFGYRGRGTDEPTRRTVSPQRLVHYRDNWYLDAWCHLRDDLRLFALDRIEAAEPLDERARDVDEATLDEHVAGAYGIFSGAATDTAVLRFSAHMARWVSEEHWHPEQRGEWQDDGRFELRVPFGDPTELVRDVLRFGADVEVVSPERLQTLVRRQLESALALYNAAAPDH